MVISPNGIKFLKHEEGFRNRAYWDKNGYAICYGNHYHPDGRPVQDGDKVNFKENSEEASNYLTSHIKKYVYNWFKFIKKPLNQNQFDSLCSFAYNVGSITKDMRKAIANEDNTKIKAAFMAKNKSGGKYDPVLEERRKREYQFYTSGTINANVSNTNISLPKIDTNLISNTIVEIAKSQIGVQEHPLGSNSGKEVNTYLRSVGLKPGNFWCMAFVFWVYDETCKRMKIANPLKVTGGVLSQWNLVKNAVKASNKESHLIVKGAIFIMKFSGGKGHTGIVESVDGGYVNTIEGNTDSEGGRDGHGVYRRRRKISSIHGFIIVQNLLQEQINPKTLVSENKTVQRDEKESTKQVQDEFTIITNTSSKITTLHEFVEAYQITITDDEVFNYEKYDNKNSIYGSYSAEKQKLYNNKPTKDYIGFGAQIAVPFVALKNKSIYAINQTIAENVAYNTFIEKNIKALLNNPNYKKILHKGEGFSTTGNLYKKEEQVQVFVWSKALDKTGAYVIDISQYIEDINVNVNKNGGNFNIVLPHLVFKDGFDTRKLNHEDLYAMEYETRNKYTINNFVHKESILREEIFDLSKTFVNFNDDNKEFQNDNYTFYKRNESFFDTHLQNNDIVFIKLEKLQVDNDRISEDLSISSDILGGSVFDLIGLVDNVSSSFNSANNDYTIHLSGKDLSKTLLDDGVYFFDVEYATDDREQIIKNSTKTKAGNRLIIPSSNTNKNEYEAHIKKNIQGFAGDITFNFDKTQTIMEWLTFIFSQLTNIDICPDSLFNSYKEKAFIITREQSQTGFDYKSVQANGIWQIMRLAIDPEISERKIADSSFTTAMGSLLNLIRKICQPPFIEFFMDTYGDKFYFICRKPPYSEQSFKTNYCINVFSDDVISDSLSFTNEFYTWYKLNPAGSIIDATGGGSLIILPAVMLPEYMEIWGSKILDVTTQYLDFDHVESDQTKQNLQNIQDQGRQDLDWLIETNAYLPFVRQGTINIKPDRRIKVGMNIRYLPTGEIYHVDGVSNSKSFNASAQQMTTLHVSRGMVEKHIDKYFNVVNLLRKSKNANKWDTDTWTVNKDNFNFLLERKQFGRK